MLSASHFAQRPSARSIIGLVTVEMAGTRTILPFDCFSLIRQIADEVFAALVERHTGGLHCDEGGVGDGGAFAAGDDDLGQRGGVWRDPVAQRVIVIVGQRLGRLLGIQARPGLGGLGLPFLLLGLFFAELGFCLGGLCSCLGSLLWVPSREWLKFGVV